MKATSILAISKAAQVWCREDTKSIVMDTVLCEAFAQVLEEILSQPWLGNATTGQLIDELRARSNLSYRTVDGGSCCAPKTLDCVGVEGGKISLPTVKP